MPETGLPYQNPYRAVGGQTFAGGSSNAMLALQDPSKARLALLQARRRAIAGMGAPVSQQDLYSDTAHGSFDFGSGGGRGRNTQGDVRIGNVPGTMSPPSPTSPYAGGSGGGGLGDFYTRQTQNNGQDITDPITGMAAAPSSFDRLQYNKGMEKAGQFGAEGVGNQYLDAQASRNPAAMGQAASTLNSFRNARQYIQQNVAPGRENAGAGMQVHGVGGAGVQNGPFGQLNWATGQWSNPAHMAKGGPVNMPRPYMVGEKGPEEFEGIDGFKQILGMNGPEVGTFGEPGKVIPNDKLSPRMQLMKHRAMGMDTKGVTHAAGGAFVDPFAKPAPLVPHVNAPNIEASPISRFFQPVGDYLSDFGDWASTPFVSPTSLPAEPNAPSFARKHPEAAAEIARNAVDSRSHGDVGPQVYPGQQSRMDAASSAYQEPNWNAPVPENPFAGPAWNVEQDPRYAGNLPTTPAPLPNYPPPPLSATIPALNVPTTVWDRMSQHGASELSGQPEGTRAFQVQNPERGFSGVASVSNAPAKERTIEGIPISEWFRRAANRQGIANKYAQVPSDSAQPAINSRMMRNNRRTSIGLPMGT